MTSATGDGPAEPAAGQTRDGIYELHPLVNAGAQIRLLKLRKRALFGALEYYMSVWDLNSAPKYRAISYTWGPTSPMKSVSIDKYAIDVRENCHSSLQQVRQHFSDDFIWIDSICIDQSSNSEKSAQVQMMGAIFSQAYSVSACLGPHAEDSEYLVRHSHAAYNISERAHNARRWWFRRPYWRRLWIVQELCLAQDICFHTGPSLLEWADVYNSMPAWMEGQYLKRLARIVNEAVTTKRPPKLQLQDQAEIFAESQCQDPRDKIYGLLNLMDQEGGENAQPIHVDYSKTALELAAQIAARYSTRRRSFFAQLQVLFKLLEVGLDEQALTAQTAARKIRSTFFSNPGAGLRVSQSICDSLSRWDFDGPFDIRQRHPGWVSSLTSCTATKLFSRGTDCASHDLYITANSSTSPFSRIPSQYIIDSAPERLYRTVRCDDEIVGVVCHDAQEGDVLLFTSFDGTDAEHAASNTYEVPSKISLRLKSHVFVARHIEGPIYQIVGQGFMVRPGTRCFGQDFNWIMGVEDAVVVMTNVQRDSTDWVDILETGVAGSEMSSFVYCTDIFPSRRRSRKKTSKKANPKPCPHCEPRSWSPDTTPRQKPPQDTLGAFHHHSIFSILQSAILILREMSSYGWFYLCIGAVFSFCFAILCARTP